MSSPTAGASSAAGPSNQNGRIAENIDEKNRCVYVYYQILTLLIRDEAL